MVEKVYYIYVDEFLSYIACNQSRPIHANYQKVTTVFNRKKVWRLTEAEYKRAKQLDEILLLWGLGVCVCNLARTNFQKAKTFRQNAEKGLLLLSGNC